MRTKRKTRSKSGFGRYDYVFSGIKLSEPLSIKQIKSIFLILLHSYFQNEIDEFFLESLAGDLFFNLSKSPNYIQSKDPELSLALDSASDIVFFLEKNDSESKKRVKTIMKVLRGYYIKNRNEIDHYSHDSSD